jgi:molecular chaperone HtpG
VTQGAADIKSIPLAEGAKPASTDTPAAVATLFAFFKQTLGDQIEDVRASDRLTDSVACLVAPEFGPDRQLEKMLASHGRLGERTKPILEVNPGHSLIASLARRLPEAADKSLIEDSAWLIFDEARLLEGDALKDATAFAARLRRVMEKALG